MKHLLFKCVIKRDANVEQMGILPKTSIFTKIIEFPVNVREFISIGTLPQIKCTQILHYKNMLYLHLVYKKIIRYWKFYEN